MTTPDEPRDSLFLALKSAYEANDPIPEGLVDRLLTALAVEDLDLEYELLTMVHRSSQLAGTRGGNDDKLVMEFSAAGVTLMLRISPIDANHRRIDGWVSPAQPLTASLWQDAATVESAVGAHGRFEFDFVPRGLTRLDLLQPGTGSSRSTAFRTTLFEI
ncbi:MAG: hypothetical protein WAS07_09120 [Micropruina sp.]|nr:hypothetical protein [Micropruina sp.]